MANHRLYLDEPCEGQVGKSTKYKYEDGVLEINWHGERTWFSFEPRSAVIVKCEGTLPDVVPAIIPENFRWRALWVCGVPKSGRCGSHAEFTARAMQENPSRISEGNGWKIAWKPDREGVERVAFGWISGKVTNNDVWQMVTTCRVTAPRWFIRQTLGF